MILCCVGAALFTSCKKNHHGIDPVELKGPELEFQHGKAWTLVKVEQDGKPVSASIVINKEAMESLSVGGSGHQHTNSASLAFNSNVTKLPYKHVLLDWNPAGHEPMPIYTIPHFDFHYYTQSEAERISIPLFEADSLRFKNFPANHFFPATYFPVPGGVPQMGAHWVDATSPELNGQIFTQTFIYGSYDGKVTFWEPMITKDFIDANPFFERAIPQPQKFQVSGYYPMKMNFKKDNGNLIVTLEDFVYRQGS